MSLTSTISLTVRAAEASAAELITAGGVHLKNFSASLASGTAADQADLAYSDRRTIAASGTFDLDLSGALVGALGAAAVFAEITTILVVADAANTNNVIIGDATAPVVGGPFGAAGDHLIAVMPGGVFFWHSGKNPAVAITATTADVLKFANSGAGTGVTYDVVILGRSA